MTRKIRAVLSINQRAIFLDQAAIIIAKQLRRRTLRTLCKERSIYFSLRASKYLLAKRLCNSWLLENNVEPIKEIVTEAKAHWARRIEVKDKHRPLFYQKMLAISEILLETIRKVEK